MESLSKERESYAKLEAEFKDLQAKFFDLREKSENEEEQVWQLFFYPQSEQLGLGKVESSTC